MGRWSLGSDKITPEKGIAYVFYLISSIILLFLLVNTKEWLWALIYLSFTLIWYVMDLQDYRFGKITSASTVSEEPRNLRPFRFLRNITNTQLFLFTIVLCFAIFFNLTSNGMSIIGVPTFSVMSVSKGVLYNSLTTAFVAIPETLLFFGLIFPTIYALIYKTIKEPMTTLLLAIILASSVFSIFHWSVYGVANLSATISTFIFGIFNCLWIYSFRSSYSLIMIHAVNNFVAVFFSMAVIGLLI